MKQIIIDYDEYLKLQKCYDIVYKERYNTGYNYPPHIEKNTQYIEDTELFKMLDDGRFLYYGEDSELQEIVITKG